MNQVFDTQWLNNCIYDIWSSKEMKQYRQLARRLATKRQFKNTTLMELIGTLSVNANRDD